MALGKPVLVYYCYCCYEMTANNSDDSEDCIEWKWSACVVGFSDIVHLQSSCVCACIVYRHVGEFCFNYFSYLVDIFPPIQPSV